MTQRLEAFQGILPKLPAARLSVWQAISSQDDKGATLAELVGILGWAINRISGRVTELNERRYLREAGVRGGQTVWAACLPQDQAAAPRRPRTVKGLVERIGQPDLFGRISILVSVPAEAVGSLKTTSTIPLKL